MGRKKTDREAKNLIPLSLIHEEDPDSTSLASQNSFDNIDPADLPSTIKSTLPDIIESPLPDKSESSDSSYCSTTEKITSKDESKRKSQKPLVSSESNKNSENEKNVLPLTTVPKRKRPEETTAAISSSTSTPLSKKRLCRSIDSFSGIVFSAFWRDKYPSMLKQNANEKEAKEGMYNSQAPSSGQKPPKP